MTEIPSVIDAPGLWRMSQHKVEFDAHKVVKKEAEVSFTKRDGTPVEFFRHTQSPKKVPMKTRGSRQTSEGFSAQPQHHGPQKSCQTAN